MTSRDDATGREAEYRVVIAQMERRLVQEAPGVLDLLELYERRVPPLGTWRPLNSGPVVYATDTMPAPER